MTTKLDKTQLIEQITEHLAQNEDSFVNACENYLGYEVTLSPHDPNTVTLYDAEYEPQHNLIYGELCYG